MNKTAYGILMFVSGAMIGATVAIKLVKTKYEKRANEEIESVREYYASKRADAVKDEIKQLDEIANKDDEDKIEAYVDLVEKSGYGATSDYEDEVETTKFVKTKNKHLLPFLPEGDVFFIRSYRSAAGHTRCHRPARHG